MYVLILYRSSFLGNEEIIEDLTKISEIYCASKDINKLRNEAEKIVKKEVEVRNIFLTVPNIYHFEKNEWFEMDFEMPYDNITRGALIGIVIKQIRNLD